MNEKLYDSPADFIWSGTVGGATYISSTVYGMWFSDTSVLEENAPLQAEIQSKKEKIEAPVVPLEISETEKAQMQIKLENIKEKNYTLLDYLKPSKFKK